MKKVRVTYSVFFFPEVSVIKLKKKRKSTTNIQTKKKNKKQVSSKKNCSKSIFNAVFANCTAVGFV
jgi:hypothetical protein